ncbi:iron-containing alcohol dehydrogenase [Polycladidibacter hongkongensis]|uniref:iron-containing alcohol dehydrogenase n=1 Tax=Polycladidibacter hongkongensis TaxID=1647556 RepID=UPI00155EABB1|nr:iron-containing alcohol dehydrogenase [Pseudovibrio hongkongensis]
MTRILYNLYKAVMKPVSRLMPISTPQVISAPNSSRQIISLLQEKKLSRPALITDSFVATTPAFQQLHAELIAAGFNTIIFDQIEPDPNIERIKKGIAITKAHGFDVVIAVGGGSSIDGAKIINACATLHKRPEAIAGTLKLRRRGNFFIAIPTTAGTGSETTLVAVMTNPAKKAKLPVVDPSLVPNVAVLDEAYMMDLPPQITATTGMDALTHAVESYLSEYSTAKTDSMNLESIRRIFTYLPRAFEDGTHDVEARQQMSRASFDAGWTFTRTSVGWVHAIAHKIGGLYGVPHGLANAIILPYVLEFYLETSAPRLAKMAAAVGLDAASETKAAQAFIHAVKDLARQLEIPSHFDCIKTEDLAAIAKAATREVNLTPHPVPRYFATERELVSFINTLQENTA